MRNSESPKLYSNIPATSMATTDASAAVASDGIAVVFRLTMKSRSSTKTNHSQIASAGSPRSAAICRGTLCRCGLSLIAGARLPVLRIDLPAPRRGRLPSADGP